MTHLPRLASLIFNRPHYITSGAAEAILAALDGRVGELGMSRFTGEPSFNNNGRWRGYSITKRGVGIVPIVGELVNRGAYLGASSGLVSYEGVQQQLRNAAADPQVRSIVLDIDSPGGMSSGCSETAALVRDISMAKPVVAVANSLTCSAAYAIASGANKIIASPSSQVGSIGVLYIHADRSGELSKRGLKFTIINAGAHKADGHPFGPLSDDVHADIQAMVNAHYEAFVNLVAEGRPSLSAEQIRDTEARVYSARDAVDNGLADEVGTFDQAVTQAESGQVSTRQQPQPSRVAQPAQPQKVAAMDLNNGAPTAGPAGGWEDMSVKEINEAVSALRATLGAPELATPAQAVPAAAPVLLEAQLGSTESAPALAQAVGEVDEGAAIAHGRADEKARIKNILGLPEAKSRPLAALALAIETDIPVSNASAVLAKVPEESAGKGVASQLYAAVAAAGGNPAVSHQEPSEMGVHRSGLGSAMDSLIAKTQPKSRLAAA